MQRKIWWWILSPIIVIVACVLAGYVLVLAVFARSVISMSSTSLTEIDAVHPTNLNGQLIFFVTKRFKNPNNIWVMWNKWELWTSDGTQDGTVMVKPVYTGWNEASITPAAFSHGWFFFAANGVEDKSEAQSWKNKGGMWRTDGTAVGTTLVETPYNEVLDINGTLFFARRQEEGCSLYRSDGTDSGTILIKQVAEQCAFRVVGNAGQLFFATVQRPDYTNCKLWSSNGTPDGTNPILEFQAKPGDSCVRDMVMFRDQLVMLLAERGVASSQLWVSNGTVSGTALAQNIPAAFIENLDFRILYVIGDHLLFSSTYLEHEDECALWVSDGTSDGTQVLKNVCLNQYKMAQIGDRLLFAADGADGGWELWVTDGTVEGTQLVRDGFTFGREGRRPHFLLVDQETLYLTIHDDRGCALWRSDGTATGTVAIHRSCPWEMVSINGTLFFTLPSGEQEVQLWKSDGTTEGTVLVKSISE